MMKRNDMKNGIRAAVVASALVASVAAMAGRYDGYNRLKAPKKITIGGQVYKQVLSRFDIGEGRVTYFYGLKEDPKGPWVQRVTIVHDQSKIGTPTVWPSEFDATVAKDKDTILHRTSVINDAAYGQVIYKDGNKYEMNATKAFGSTVCGGVVELSANERVPMTASDNQATQAVLDTVVSKLQNNLAASDWKPKCKG